MEQNSIAKTHKIELLNRKQMELGGIKDVVTFDLSQVLLESTMGMIHIKGKDMKVNRLSLDKGEVSLSGNVDSIVYSDVKAYKEKGKSFIKRMFK
jgi:sporulation protein YabP